MGRDNADSIIKRRGAAGWKSSCLKISLLRIKAHPHIWKALYLITIYYGHHSTNVWLVET